MSTSLDFGNVIAVCLLLTAAFCIWFAVAIAAVRWFAKRCRNNTVYVSARSCDGCGANANYTCAKCGELFCDDCGNCYSSACDYCEKAPKELEM